MATEREYQSLEVPATATQEVDVRVRWTWVEHAVWTPRMLTALEQGVKGNYFAEQGLYSLKTAHTLACQSSSR
jgi:hypothetical protein